MEDSERFSIWECNAYYWNNLHFMLTWWFLGLRVILVFLAFNASPSYISDLFTELQTSISLRGKCRPVISRVNTTNYGLHSFRYHASKLWNLFPDDVRVSTSLAAFKIALKTVQLDILWPMLNSQITCTYMYIFFYL